jgi:glycerophosphoryl diester phosphodiesterase
MLQKISCSDIANKKGAGIPMKKSTSGFFRKIVKSKGFWMIFGFFFFLWLNNTSLFTDRNGKELTLIAHGALGQTYDLEGVKWNTNTAAIIHEPEHSYIENTLLSIQAAFNYGADIVEFDIRLTEDKQLAVFHDETLEYRTDGKGYVSDHTMDELRQLDVGFGYTADNGRTFPLRGKGIGLMVSIEDIFHTFPDREFLIHVKDGGDEIGPILLDFLKTLDKSAINNISVYGNDPALDLLRDHYPEVKILSKFKMVDAFLRYLLIGWTGVIPDAIRNIEIHLPLKYAKLFWGWPDKFLQRMDKANTRVVLVQYVNGWSDGFDSETDLMKLPENYTGGIWTNRIDIIGPVLKK